MAERYRLFQVDAFSDRPFAGNPAAVMPLAQWLPDEVLQALAAENNLSETAFFVPEGDGFALRWFTPVSEVPLCGHATLASAWVLFERLGYDRPEIRFFTRERGTLTVRRGEKGRLLLDFPKGRIKTAVIPEGLERLLCACILEAHTWADLGEGAVIAVLATPSAVKELHLDSALLKSVGVADLVVTAEVPEKEKGDWGGADFVCRFFAPSVGIAEDPVTGALHTVLVPFWAQRLGRNVLISKQVSRRGGLLYCRISKDRVEIGGHAALYLEGEVTL